MIIHLSSLSAQASIAGATKLFNAYPEDFGSNCTKKNRLIFSFCQAQIVLRSYHTPSELEFILLDEELTDAFRVVNVVLTIFLTKLSQKDHYTN